jgi:hypothetical protein
LIAPVYSLCVLVACIYFGFEEELGVMSLAGTSTRHTHPPRKPSVLTQWGCCHDKNGYNPCHWGYIEVLQGLFPGCMHIFWFWRGIGCHVARWYYASTRHTHPPRKPSVPTQWGHCDGKNECNPCHWGYIYVLKGLFPGCMQLFWFWRGIPQKIGSKTHIRPYLPLPMTNTHGIWINFDVLSTREHFVPFLGCFWTVIEVFMGISGFRGKKWSQIHISGHIYP